MGGALGDRDATRVSHGLLVLVGSAVTPARRALWALWRMTDCPRVRKTAQPGTVGTGRWGRWAGSSPLRGSNDSHTVFPPALYGETHLFLVYTVNDINFEGGDDTSWQPCEHIVAPIPSCFMTLGRDPLTQ